MHTYCFPTTFIENRSQTPVQLEIVLLVSLRERRTFFADDIFTHLNDVANETNDLPAGLTINGIAASWINRDRVPLVTVIRDYKTRKINLSQVSRTEALFPAKDARRAKADTRFSHG